MARDISVVVVVDEQEEKHSSSSLLFSCEWIFSNTISHIKLAENVLNISTSN